MHLKEEALLRGSTRTITRLRIPPPPSPEEHRCNFAFERGGGQLLAGFLSALLWLCQGCDDRVSVVLDCSRVLVGERVGK